MKKLPVDILMWTKFSTEDHIKNFLRIMRRYKFDLHAYDIIGCASVRGYLAKKHIQEVEKIITVSGVYVEKSFDLPMLPGEVGPITSETELTDNGCTHSSNSKL